MCLYNLIMDHDAPIFPIPFTHFRTPFSPAHPVENTVSYSFFFTLFNVPGARLFVRTIRPIDLCRLSSCVPGVRLA